jgi:acetylornithine deacetylase/succinyl-diaminopimelate desuccinylase-like protein
MAETCATIAELPEALTPLRAEFLANVVMLGQIPAPTGEEAERVRFILDRFAEAGLPEAGRDEMGNAVGEIPGTTRERRIMLVAHLDTIVPSNVDHNVLVQSDRIVGPGVSDNSLGIAVLSMIPTCLSQLNIKLASDLKLVATVQSLHRGNHAGLKFHLDHMREPVDFGVCIEGVQLGRLDYFSIGTLRGDITCSVRPILSRSYGSESAVAVLNRIINQMLSIEIPQRPFTRINIGRLRAGVSYDTEPDHAELGFEILSHSDEMIGRLHKRLEQIVNEVSARHAVDALLDCFFRREAGGIAFGHPLVQAILGVMQTLGIEPDQGHSPSELSEFIARGIPAVTLGLTTGEKNRKKPDHIMIDPLLTGISQLLGALLAIDSGVCDEG